MDLTPGLKTDSPTSPTPTSESSAFGQTAGELRNGASRPPLATGDPNAVRHQGDGAQPNDSGILQG